MTRKELQLRMSSMGLEIYLFLIGKDSRSPTRFGFCRPDDRCDSVYSFWTSSLGRQDTLGHFPHTLDILQALYNYGFPAAKIQKCAKLSAVPATKYASSATLAMTASNDAAKQVCLVSHVT